MMCNAPPGLNATELFEPHVGRGGHLCYDVPEFNPLPMLYCQEYLYVWAVGGRPTRFQELVGYPFGDSGTEVYYLLEVHYDNPRRTPGLTFVTGVSIYHTAELREVDAGLMWTPYDNNPSLIIPPETTGFTISTHCAPACTQKLPADGIKIFNVLLHSHIAGCKIISTITPQHFKVLYLCPFQEGK